MNKIAAPAHNIGGYVPMIDGPEKVSGRAKYTADILGAGQLAGRIYRSPYSHGEIVDVDVSEALKLPGVKAIVTGADCDKGFGVLPIARTRISAGARQSALPRRAGRGGRRGRRRHRARGAAPHQVHGARTAGLLHRQGRARARTPCRCTTRSPAISSATCCSSSARPRRASPRPIWCAKAPTTAPKSARTRWRCTPRSPNTTRCASA